LNIREHFPFSQTKRKAHTPKLKPPSSRTTPTQHPTNTLKPTLHSNNPDPPPRKRIKQKTQDTKAREKKAYFVEPPTPL